MCGWQGPSERLRDKGLTIKRYINSSVYLYFLFCWLMDQLAYSLANWQSSNVSNVACCLYSVARKGENIVRIAQC